ncbi:hypothetical protein [Candidatus Ichthyocystis sparus]|uniref:hypothetical protein n=1 Tax=Candidatus Ichthyocystis sparus TaxID=1561004 RepID=UPI000B834F9D|nr:hypothetical protein [Candidatus Ichthyocystis sparus]
MSDKKIYGTSVSSSDSETDESDSGRNKSPPEAVCQDAGSEKSEKKGGDGSSGRSLLASNDSYRSVQELGSKPKTRGKVGKGKGHKQEKRLCMEQPCPKIS